MTLTIAEAEAALDAARRAEAEAAQRQADAEAADVDLQRRRAELAAVKLQKAYDHHVEPQVRDMERAVDRAIADARKLDQTVTRDAALAARRYFGGAPLLDGTTREHAVANTDPVANALLGVYLSVGHLIGVLGHRSTTGGEFTGCRASASLIDRLYVAESKVWRAFIVRVRTLGDGR